jgi:hypothetical protein
MPPSKHTRILAVLLGTLTLGTAALGDDLPPVGNPDGNCPIPAAAALEDVSKPTTVIGNGTPASCTANAVVQGVAKGGIITFNCGPDPITITLSSPAKIFNNTGPKIVIDGGGKVTLSGGGSSRILYMNTCDPALVWTTSHCQDQDHPQLTVQNLTFVDANSSGANPDGGGAIWARGGRIKVVNSRFFRNRCDAAGPDLGGAALRVFSQSQNLPAYVVNSTFGGRADLGNVCSNGGAISSIGVSYTVLNSLFTHNKAIDPSNGGGGAIYNDGNKFDLQVCGSALHDNTATGGGGAIFFVSNDRSGTLQISNSVLRANTSARYESAGLPGIFYLGNGNPTITNSTLTPGTTTSAVDCLLNWGERQYASLLWPAPASSQTYGPYYYRYYAGTNSYVGVSSANDHLYYQGRDSNGQLLDLGTAASWKQTAGCQ